MNNLIFHFQPLSKLKNKISSFHSKSDKPNQKNSIIMSVENLKNIYDKLSSSKVLNY